MISPISKAELHCSAQLPSPAQHKRLIDAALLLYESGLRCKAVSSLSKEFLSLHPEQYDRLADQVLSEPGDNPKLNATVCLALNTQLPDW